MYSAESSKAIGGNHVTFLHKCKRFLTNDLVFWLKYFSKDIIRIGVTFGIVFLGFLFSISLSENKSLVDAFTENYSLTLSGSFIITVLTLLKESGSIWISKGFSKYQKKSLFARVAVIKTITDIIRNNIAKEEIEHLLNKLLSHMENDIESQLNNRSKKTGNISCNLMIKKENSLVIKYFSLKSEGHCKKGFTININNDYPGVGAALAYVKNIPCYVDDVKNNKDFIKCNDNNEVKSFISFPIEIARNKEIAILNVDSDNIDQFISRRYIHSELKYILKLYFAIIATIL